MDGWIISAWGRILAGYMPALSIEITRECPLHCPGCYAYGDDHLGGDMTLREVRDFKGQELVDGVLALVDRHKPLHVSIVGGEPLVRYRELEHDHSGASRRAAFTRSSSRAPSARFRRHWPTLPRTTIVVSIDGLQPEHDVRRTPATYDRILKHIVGIRSPCTARSPGSRSTGRATSRNSCASGPTRTEVRKIWISLYTPQIGESLRGAADAGRSAAGRQPT